MEQIIILAVIGLLSTLFSKKNKGDAGTKDVQETRRMPEPQQKTPRPASQQPDPFKRLKELTGDIYREIQEEQRKTVEEQPPARPEIVRQPPGAAKTPKPAPRAAGSPVKNEGQRNSAPRSGRLSAHNPAAAAEESANAVRLSLTDEEDILKGIIFSEILGPPKSKRR
ncbi:MULTISPECIES: hypothetical protein [Sporosarcina]|uniref:hypothetical protein n=1 Tax=Sporosarcina TaxID=1569 RepID=UPI00058F40D1|nr:MULTISPECIES: hypothetical protein [Sporosarcina]WJY28504.1 hypothetical protein QWT68_05840 [Sporosarcina sp. 0.2-SM1T-5]